MRTRIYTPIFNCVIIYMFELFLSLICNRDLECQTGLAAFGSWILFSTKYLRLQI